MVTSIRLQVPTDRMTHNELAIYAELKETPGAVDELTAFIEGMQEKYTVSVSEMAQYLFDGAIERIMEYRYTPDAALAFLVQKDSTARRYYNRLKNYDLASLTLALQESISGQIGYCPVCDRPAIMITEESDFTYYRHYIGSGAFVRCRRNIE